MLKEMSSWLFHGSRVVEFLQLGVSSNWFGLACPHHCYPSALPSLALSFVLGLFVGSIVTIGFGFWAFHLLLPRSSPSSQGVHSHPGSRLSRLQGYLHERGPYLVERVVALETELRVLKEQRATLSLGSYSAVGASSATSSVAGDVSSIASNDYNTLAEAIPPVPQDVLRACSLLTGGGVPFSDRASRAWEAGCWARFVLEGQISKPRPSKPLALPNQYYVVLRAEGFACPLLCDKARGYRYVVGDFKKNTLSHGFPSKCEAWTYARAAGYPLPSEIFRWNPNM